MYSSVFITKIKNHIWTAFFINKELNKNYAIIHVMYTYTTTLFLIKVSYIGLPFKYSQFSSVQFSPSFVSDSLRPHEPQHARPPCPSPTPGVHSNSCPSSRWCQPAISSSVVPSSSAPGPSQHQGLFQWVNSWHEVAKVLEFQFQHQSIQWTPRTDLL